MPIYKMDGKKDGKQKYRVRINFKDSYGNDKQIDRVVYGSEEAKDLEKKLRSELKEQPPESRITVRQLYEEYIQNKKYEVRETTLHKTQTILSNHALPVFESKKLNQLTLITLQKWKRAVEEKGLSVTMKKNIFGEFRTMLNYGVKFGHLPSNPLPRVGNFKDPYETKKAIDFYTPDEFLKFMEAAKKAAEENGFYEWNYYVFFAIAFYTGLRKGEINALKWSDIEENTLHVKRSIAQKLRGGDREPPPRTKAPLEPFKFPCH